MDGSGEDRLYLSDSSIRIYRCKTGDLSFRLRSSLMVPTNVGFKLGAYLKNVRLSLRLASDSIIEFDEVGIREDCWYELGVMVHDLHAWARPGLVEVPDRVGILRVDYHLSFTGHPSEEGEGFEVRVPLVRREWNPRRLPWRDQRPNIGMQPTAARVRMSAAAAEAGR